MRLLPSRGPQASGRYIESQITGTFRAQKLGNDGYGLVKTPSSASLMLLSLLRGIILRLPSGEARLFYSSSLPFICTFSCIILDIIRIFRILIRVWSCLTFRLRRRILVIIALLVNWTSHPSVRSFAHKGVAVSPSCYSMIYRHLPTDTVPWTMGSRPDPSG